MKKKLLALVLVLALALSLVTFAACADTSSGAIDKLNALTLLYEKDDDMINTYSMLAVNPSALFVNASVDSVTDIKVNTAGADAFISWMSLLSTRNLIKDYGFNSYGEYLFYLQEDSTILDIEIPKATESTKVIRLSTTTSVNDSGLMDYLTPYFENEYGYDVQVQSAGTGAAINAAKYGNADMILVHSKSQEDAFVEAGFSRIIPNFNSARVTFMYNYFVLIGPKSDPADVQNAATIKAAFANIAKDAQKFISRGDNSGTHTKELSLWDTSLKITSDTDGSKDDVEGCASYDWYISAGQGMGACLIMANEQNAYVLSDKATYLTYKNFIES